MCEPRAALAADGRAPDVHWRDLLVHTRARTLAELALPLPWLAIAIACGVAGWSVASVLATFVLFMTGLRVTHGAFHRSLGLPRGGDDAAMFVLSVLLGGSMHAIEFTHLRHHRRCLGPDDVEGHIAHLSFWRALLHSPAYPLRIHATALRDGDTRRRRWVLTELAAVLALQCCVWASGSAALQAMTLALVFANLSAAMVGIWAVHRADDAIDDAPGLRARTSRSRLLDFAVAGMFHHLEHHLYPAVPTWRLPVLARRFDAARSGSVRTVFGGVVRGRAPSL